MKEAVIFNLLNSPVVYETKDNKLIFSCSLVTTRTTMSVEKYNSAKSFYSKIMEAEQLPVVLLKKCKV
jgi:hypothetical protein